MRRIPALLTAAIVLTSLAACAPSGPGASAGCDAPLQPGAASETVTAEGGIGSDPETDFPSPLVTEGSQRSVLVEGDGDTLRDGDSASVVYSVYAADGTPLGSTGYEGDTLSFRDAGDSNSIDESIVCSAEGSRIALTTTAAEAFGEGVLSQSGVQDDATIVFVIDVVDRYLGKADGLNQLPEAGLPSVVTAPDGQPGITLPTPTPPDGELHAAVIKAGGGQAVAEGDQIVVKYTGWVWEQDPTSFDSAWERGVPTAFDLVASDGETQGGLISGFVKGLDGQKVGSQVLLVVPPEEGYGDSQAGSIAPGSTLVFVVDILGVVR
ncbi:FKBP-type peptidyl-prolyl cis-trans isomerase [Homoserinibacter sp. YIM 151385]|uniref:FKBP-type peptidyl-prolyl cis-trans isomerase n=1 Tax=Homoserinibacter sp. YIM 151385 TaxID=2985506 RepID=UPI0022EFF769|nr:FKBP-type peptidyl-prolyl cis-trans isomerase [Homoserinibacter sp. YIM 151385]WBU38552.1 FKBP-type peptidyl-prolyl cis-trans isomerase [Homoserinibacter sp. YIM 151385]